MSSVKNDVLILESLKKLAVRDMEKADKLYKGLRVWSIYDDSRGGCRVARISSRVRPSRAWGLSCVAYAEFFSFGFPISGSPCYGEKIHRLELPICGVGKAHGGGYSLTDAAITAALQKVEKMADRIAALMGVSVLWDTRPDWEWLAGRAADRAVERFAACFGWRAEWCI